MSTILVLGAHGTVGAALASQLAADGHGVRRAGRRAPAQPGDVRLDLASGEGVAEAFEGADAAFLMSPPGHLDQDRLLGRAIDAAVAAGVSQVVMMTAMGADADERAPMRIAERHLERSGLRWTVLRPNWFMQNFHTYWIDGILRRGAIELPVGNAKGSFIDARDIAASAAAVFARRDLDGQAFDLTGPEALDHDAVAAVLSQAAGRAIRYTAIGVEEMRAALLRAGLGPDYTGFMLEILGYFALGAAERVTGAVQTLTGRPPRTLAEYARDHREAWRS